jgi:hypothetical protein
MVFGGRDVSLSAVSESRAFSIQELSVHAAVHRLHMPMQLRKTMASTNAIESVFSIVEHVCHGGDQQERWVGSGLLAAEKQFQGSQKKAS